MEDNISLTIVAFFFTIYTILKDMYSDKNKIKNCEFIKIVLLTIIFTVALTYVVLKIQ